MPEANSPSSGEFHQGSGGRESDPIYGQLPRRIYLMAAAIVWRKGRTLVGKYGFTTSDLEDLRQDLFVDLVRAWPRFSARRGTPSSFVNLLVDRRIASTVRKLRAEKRGGGRFVDSLDRQIEDAQGNVSCLVEGLSEEASKRDPGDSRRDQLDLRNLQVDVRATLSRLPRDQKDIAKHLMNHSRRQIAKKLGIPRRHVDQVVAQIRARFEDSELQDYL